VLFRSFVGWFKGDTKYTKTEPTITADITLEAKWVEDDGTYHENSLYKPGFQALGDFDTGQQWENITVAEMQAAKYLILEVESDGEDGLGGVQMATNGGGGWDDISICASWSGDAMKADEPNGWLVWGESSIYYIVIDLSVPSFKAVIDKNFYEGGSYRQLIINGDGGAVVKNGYLVTVTLTKPTDKFYVLEDGGTTFGWAAPNVPEGKN
jgi:hypothetical protein